MDDDDVGILGDALQLVRPVNSWDLAGTVDQVNPTRNDEPAGQLPKPINFDCIRADDENLRGPLYIQNTSADYGFPGAHWIPNQARLGRVFNQELDSGELVGVVVPTLWGGCRKPGRGRHVAGGGYAVGIGRKLGGVAPVVPVGDDPVTAPLRILAHAIPGPFD